MRKIPNVNTENVLRLATALENNEFEYLDFQMQTVAAPKDYKEAQCGSACCMIGYALAVKNGKFVAPGDMNDYEHACDHPIVKEAREFLGLGEKSAMRLFFPDDNPDESGMRFRDLWNVTRQDAAKVLRGLAADRKIDWSPVAECLHNPA